MNAPELCFAIACVLFSIGCIGVLSRKNVLITLMNLELMFAAVNLMLIGFSAQNKHSAGLHLALFVIAIAAAKAALSLVLLAALYRRVQSTEVDQLTMVEQENLMR